MPGQTAAEQQLSGMNLPGLPEAPDQAKTPGRTAAAATEAQGSISGIVSDIGGALVADAHVTLTQNGQAGERTTTSDSSGHFTFADVPPGTYTVVISSTGLETFVSPGVVLKPGQRLDLPDIALPIATSKEEVTVTLTREQLATEEVHAEEKQRVLGVFPNFYTSFVWNAAPMNSRQKFGLMLHATTDPMAFVTAGVVAGAEQSHNTFPEWDGGPEGYARRYGAAYADAFIGKFIGSAILPSVFRQDPRYFYMGSGTTKQRAKHAIVSAVLARGDNGRWQPNYSHILGNASAGAISTLYHPASNSAGKLALDNALIGIGGTAFVNLTREFLFKPFTHGIPAYSKGKP